MSFAAAARARIVRVQDQELAERLYAFRYRVFQELGAALPVLARASARLEDEWDSVASNYAAFGDERIVGSLRIIDQRDLGEPAALLARHAAEATSQRFGASAICFGGRLAVAPELRGTPLTVRLIARAYGDCRARSIRFAFSDCSSELWPFYRRIGFRRFGPDFTDPMFGLKLRLLLVLGDLAYLREVRSPLLALAEHLPSDAQGREWATSQLQSRG